jgi:hypothetical protein
MARRYGLKRKPSLIAHKDGERFCLELLWRLQEFSVNGNSRKPDCTVKVSGRGVGGKFVRISMGYTEFSSLT